MTIKPCAKINIGLNVVNKRPDGYHNLQTVFYPVNILDEIDIEETPSQENDCVLEMKGTPVAGDADSNLVVKAYRLLARHYTLPHVKITLGKHIPMQAGMGGGSADCACTIRLLDKMFSLGMTVEEMQRHAATLGADCAFFITSSPSYAEGIGEKLTPVSLDLSQYKILVVKPDIAIPTKEAFANITPSIPAKCCKEIITQPIETWREELRNDFEASIFPQHPQLASIKERLYKMGALYAAMSGSGSALFGIFKDPPSTDGAFPGCFTAIV